MEELCPLFSNTVTVYRRSCRTPSTDFPMLWWGQRGGLGLEGSGNKQSRYLGQLYGTVTEFRTLISYIDISKAFRMCHALSVRGDSYTEAMG